MESKPRFDLKILYIEDEADTLEPMKRFLQRRFSTVWTAKDGEEAWKKFIDIHPDLLITDLVLPELSGVDLIKRIRETGYSYPIIITSASQDVETIVKTVEFGISKYIIKPINLDELGQLLDKLGHDIMENQRKCLRMSFAEKKYCELNLKPRISNLIKQYTGKGPKDIKVIIGSEQIYIKASCVRTILENTLYQNGNNIALVEQNRRLLYQIMKLRLEESVSEAIGALVRLTEIEIDCKRDSETVTFSLN